MISARFERRLWTSFSGSGLPGEYTSGMFHFDATAKPPRTKYLPRELTSNIASPNNILFAN